MSEARDVAQRVIDAVNTHDLSALGGLYAAGARTCRPGWPEEADAEYLLASYEMDFACVPDIHFEPLSVTSEGARIVTELRISGINTGPTVLGDFGKALLGADVEAVPPTGRPIDLPAVLVHEVADGKVAAERQYWGLLEFLVQTGVIARQAATRPGSRSAKRSLRSPPGSEFPWREPRRGRACSSPSPRAC
jgi:hypothetical protein